jgi:hypothetical protein
VSALAERRPSLSCSNEAERSVAVARERRELGGKLQAVDPMTSLAGVALQRVKKEVRCTRAL